MADSMAVSGPQNSTSKQLGSSSGVSGSCFLFYLGTLFLAPLPFTSSVPASWASLGFLIHLKVVFTSELLHLFLLPGVQGLSGKNSSLKAFSYYLAGYFPDSSHNLPPSGLNLSHLREALLVHLIRSSPSSHSKSFRHSFLIVSFRF